MTLSGSGTLSFSQGQSGANLTGTGSLTASPVLAGAASLTGLGTLTAAPRLVATAALSGTGTLTVPGTPPAGYGTGFLAFFP